MRRKHQEFLAAERGWIPSHAGVLRPAEQVAGRPLAQHLRRQRQRARRSWRARRDIEESRIVGIEGVRRHGVSGVPGMVLLVHCQRPHGPPCQRSFNDQTDSLVSLLSSSSCSSDRPPFAAAQGFGIKVGPTFDEFSGEVLNFDNRTGIHAGLFIGGSRDKVVGFQTEFNWLRKHAETEGGREIRIDYLQIPGAAAAQYRLELAERVRVLRRRRTGIELKIADEIEGLTLVDGFEGADVSLLFGGGFEVARIIVEGRYEKGLRRINNTFSNLLDIKKQSFTILFGLRFK